MEQERSKTMPQDMQKIYKRLQEILEETSNSWMIEIETAIDKGFMPPSLDEWQAQTLTTFIQNEILDEKKISNSIFCFIQQFINTDNDIEFLVGMITKKQRKFLDGLVESLKTKLME